MHFEHIDSLPSQIALLDEDIYQKLEIHNKEFELIQTIPSINAITGASIIALIGVDMSRFPSEHHLASWAASRTKGTYLAAKYHITANTCVEVREQQSRSVIEFSM